MFRWLIRLLIINMKITQCSVLNSEIHSYSYFSFHPHTNEMLYVFNEMSYYYTGSVNQWDGSLSFPLSLLLTPSQAFLQGLPLVVA